MKILIYLGIVNFSICNNMAGDNWLDTSNFGNWNNSKMEHRAENDNLLSRIFKVWTQYFNKVLEAWSWFSIMVKSNCIQCARFATWDYVSEMIGTTKTTLEGNKIQSFFRPLIFFERSENRRISMNLFINSYEDTLPIDEVEKYTFVSRSLSTNALVFFLHAKFSSIHRLLEFKFYHSSHAVRFQL